jgi:hypothetical protein
MSISQQLCHTAAYAAVQLHHWIGNSGGARPSAMLLLAHPPLGQAGATIIRQNSSCTLATCCWKQCACRGPLSEASAPFTQARMLKALQPAQCGGAHPGAAHCRQQATHACRGTAPAAACFWPPLPAPPAAPLLPGRRSSLPASEPTLLPGGRPCGARAPKCTSVGLLASCSSTPSGATWSAVVTRLARGATHIASIRPRNQHSTQLPAVVRPVARHRPLFSASIQTKCCTRRRLQRCT